MLRWIYFYKDVDNTQKMSLVSVEKVKLKQDVGLFLSVAKEYQMSDLWAKVFHIAYKTLKVSNVKRKLQKANDGDCPAMKDVCLVFVKNNGKEMFKDPQILAISSENPVLWAQMVDAAFEESSSDSSSSDSSSSDSDDFSVKEA